MCSKEIYIKISYIYISHLLIHHSLEDVSITNDGKHQNPVGAILLFYLCSCFFISSSLCEDVNFDSNSSHTLSSKFLLSHLI